MTSRPAHAAELRRWRRRLWLDLAAWLSPLVGYPILLLLSALGWLELGEMTWLALSSAVTAWVVFGTGRVRRTFDERPGSRER